METYQTEKSMSEASLTCLQTTFEDSSNVISSQALEAGLTRSVLPAGVVRFGLEAAPASHSQSREKVAAHPTPGTYPRPGKQNMTTIIFGIILMAAFIIALFATARDSNRD